MIDSIDYKYINFLSSRLERFKKVNGNFNFRCYFCNDSKKSKTLTRGWILTNQDNPTYYCHNCHVSLSFNEFLEQVDPTLYKEYRLEKFKDHNTSQSVFDKKVIQPVFKAPVFKTRHEFFSICNSLDTLPQEHPAVHYISSREIPVTQWNKIYYTEDFKDIYSLDTDDKYHKPTSKVVDRRIIFPQWGPDGLVGISGRSIEPETDRRYVTLKFLDDPFPLVFGLYNSEGELILDKAKPLLITEGAIDSLFLENSIAVGGADLTRVLNLLQGYNLIFIPDNENRNKQVLSVYDKVIKLGMKICIMPDTIYKKDLNLIYMYEEKDLKTLIDNNTYQGVAATLKFTSWKKY